MLGPSIKKRAADAGRMRCDAHLKPRNRARMRAREWLRHVPGDHRGARAVLLALIEKMNDFEPGREVWPSQETLQAETGLGRTWVRECLAWLELAHAIQRAQAGLGRGRSTRYFIAAALWDADAWPLADFRAALVGQGKPLPDWGLTDSSHGEESHEAQASAPNEKNAMPSSDLAAQKGPLAAGGKGSLSGPNHLPQGASFASSVTQPAGPAQGCGQSPAADAAPGAGGRGRSPRPPVVTPRTGGTASAGKLTASASVAQEVHVAAGAARKVILAGAGASSSPFAALARRSQKSRTVGRSDAAVSTGGGDEPPARPSHDPARVAAAKELLRRLAAWGAARWEICGGEREELAPGRTENKGWSCPPRPRRWSSGGLAIDSSARPVAVENLDLPAIDAWAAAGPRREVFMRPSRSEAHSIIFLDDVAADQIERFPCNWARAIFKTSSNSHQVILRLPFAMNRADRTRAQRALIKLLNVGDPAAADGGQLFRVPFLSCNFKRCRDGFRTKLVEFREGDPVEIELIEAGAGMDQAAEAPAAPAHPVALVKKPGGTAGISESEKDWARVRHQLKRGITPAAVIDELARAALSRGKAPTAVGCRAYAQRTVHKALESLQSGRRSR